MLSARGSSCTYLLLARPFGLMQSREPAQGRPRRFSRIPAGARLLLRSEDANRLSLYLAERPNVMNTAATCFTGPDDVGGKSSALLIAPSWIPCATPLPPKAWDLCRGTSSIFSRRWAYCVWDLVCSVSGRKTLQSVGGLGAQASVVINSFSCVLLP